MEVQETDKQIREVLLKERQEAVALRNEVSQHLFDLRSQNLVQRRELLKHISLISAAILGLTTIVTNDSLIKSYFITGICLHITVIVLVLSYLREHLDKESNGLQFQQDEYSDIIQEKMDLIDEYLPRQNLTKEMASEYVQRLYSTPAVQKLMKVNYELGQQRKNRQNQPLDYFPEFVVFIFLSASFLILISFFDDFLNIYFLVLVIAFFAFISFFDTASFLSKKITKIVTFFKILPKKEIELHKIDTLTIGDIIENESQYILTADKRYGAFFKNAADFNALLHSFVKEVKAEGWIFTMFLSQVRKHHTLALFSAVRRHHVQTQMDLRQTMEAGVNAAYAIENPKQEDFVTKEAGILNAPRALTEKRYKWLEDNYKKSSDFLKNQKRNSNQAAHSNIIYAFLNFDFGEMEKRRFNTPFFDKDDDYMIKTNLWFIGNLALGLMALFFGVNQKNKIIIFADDFLPRLKALETENHRLKQEMMKSSRFKKAITLEKEKSGIE